MAGFELILRDWVKTTGFFTHELVKRFFIIYPLVCIASDCYLQVQVAFQAWFETIEHGTQESQTPSATPTLPQDISSTDTQVARIPSSREHGRSSLVVLEHGSESGAEQQLTDIEEAVRGFLAEEFRSQESNAEEPGDLNVQE